jgi:hypothetical protein
MDKLFDRIRDWTTKLWRFEVVGGLQPQQLKENVYMGPTLRRETKGYLTVG